MLEQPEDFISGQSKSSKHCQSLHYTFHKISLTYTITQLLPWVLIVQENQTRADEVHSGLLAGNDDAHDEMDH